MVLDPFKMNYYIVYPHILLFELLLLLHANKILSNESTVVTEKEQGSEMALATNKPPPDHQQGSSPEVKRCVGL